MSTVCVCIVVIHIKSLAEIRQERALQQNDSRAQPNERGEPSWILSH